MSEGSSTVGWRLPASKTDTRALGESIQDSCWCAGESPWCDLCPFHVALDFKQKPLASFPDADPAVLPLFPSNSGATLSRVQTVAAIRAVVGGSGQDTSVELVHAGCSEVRERSSEHSMRVSGAQLFAKMGWNVAVIMALGRWGSMAVARYEGVPLSVALSEGPAQPAQHSTAALQQQVDVFLLKLEEQKALLDGITASAQKTLGASSHQGEPSKPVPMVIRNLSVGMRHVVLIGCSADTDLEASLYRSHCGWRFATGAKYVTVSDHTDKRASVASARSARLSPHPRATHHLRETRAARGPQNKRPVCAAGRGSWNSELDGATGIPGPPLASRRPCCRASPACRAAAAPCAAARAAVARLLQPPSSPPSPLPLLRVLGAHISFLQ